MRALRRNVVGKLAPVVEEVPPFELLRLREALVGKRAPASRALRLIEAACLAACWMAS